MTYDIIKHLLQSVCFIILMSASACAAYIGADLNCPTCLTVSFIMIVARGVISVLPMTTHYVYQIGHGFSLYPNSLC